MNKAGAPYILHPLRVLARMTTTEEHLSPRASWLLPSLPMTPPSVIPPPYGAVEGATCPFLPVRSLQTGERWGRESKSKKNAPTAVHRKGLIFLEPARRLELLTC